MLILFSHFFQAYCFAKDLIIRLSTYGCDWDLLGKSLIAVMNGLLGDSKAIPYYNRPNRVDPKVSDDLVKLSD